MNAVRTRSYTIRLTGTLSLNKESPFAERLAVLGDPAETLFDLYAESLGWASERFGFNRPNFQSFWQLAPQLRALPDRIVETDGQSRHVLVECVGIGRDQAIKIRVEKLNATVALSRFWSIPVLYFVFDSFRRRVNFGHDAEELYQLVAGSPEIPLQYFDYEVPYFRIAASLLDNWRVIPESLWRKYLTVSKNTEK